MKGLFSILRNPTLLAWAPGPLPPPRPILSTVALDPKRALQALAHGMNGETTGNSTLMTSHSRALSFPVSVSRSHVSRVRYWAPPLAGLESGLCGAAGAVCGAGV